MVSFRIMVSALALAAPIVAQTSTSIVTTLTTLKSKSQALTGAAEAADIFNANLILFGTGPYAAINEGFDDINTIISNFVQTADASTITGAGSTAVANAFKGFTDALFAILDILIKKEGLLDILPIIGQSVYTVLIQNKSALDLLTMKLTSKVPSQVTGINSDGSKVAALAGTAAGKYDGSLLTKRSMRFRRREVIAAA